MRENIKIGYNIFKTLNFLEFWFLVLTFFIETYFPSICFSPCHLFPSLNANLRVKIGDMTFTC